MGLPPDPAATDSALLQSLLSAFPDSGITGATANHELTVVSPPSLIPDLLQWLRDGVTPPYRMLADLTAVDLFPREPRFEVVYHLLAFDHGQRIRIKTRVSADAPVVPSVVSLWPAAGMLEREVFDLFGIQFAGHPNLKRLLMPNDWQGHPLRKDYPVEGER